MKFDLNPILKYRGVFMSPAVEDNSPPAEDTKKTVKVPRTIGSVLRGSVHHESAKHRERTIAELMELQLDSNTGATPGESPVGDKV